MIADTPLTVFDIETTGLNPEVGDRIVEIAGIRIEGGRIQKEGPFHSLVNPQCPVPWEARSVHRISGEELASAPTITEILPQFLAFARGSILIAHNAKFDRSFLDAEKDMCWGYVDIPECLCTLTLSRSIHPHEYRHGLDAVAERLGIAAPGDLHRALPDALLTAQVFLKLVECGQIHSLEELRAKASLHAAAWR